MTEFTINLVRDQIVKSIEELKEYVAGRKYVDPVFTEARIAFIQRQLADYQVLKGMK